MKHLTIDEIKKFVSIDKMDDESKSLASKVNLHILKCDKCLKTVEAYQDLHDELKREGTYSKENGYFCEIKGEAEELQRLKLYL